MFDAETAALISRAPALEGVDLAALPQRLTDAYASIVAMRMRLRGAAATERILPGETAALVGEMRRLAFTHEAFVSALPARDDRAAAAFVAGAAHHVSLLAQRVLDNSPSTYLGFDSISADVSATLLFLVAEATADAAEMAKSIVVRTDDAIETALLSSIRLLANGRLEQLLESAVPAPEQFLLADPPIRALRSLHYVTLRGVRELAASMLGRGDNVGPNDGQGAIDIFERVKRLCIDQFDGELGNGLPSIYPGPLHLASLLSQAARDLSSAALVNVPAPDGLDLVQWNGLMRDIARRRPYIWRNHRQAIEAGYLSTGVSAAISFPTGAGKSALAELKIAAALLRGTKVVFLAPTLALVDQTARSLAATFRGAEVQRERAEELQFDVETLPTISVMTPERCLALLSFNRGVFADVGLLIFDECHLLHPRDSDNSRRAIDSMLCVLNFTAVAPAADVLFLSAMMMNAEEIAAWLQGLTTRTCLSLSLTWKPTRQVRGCVVYNTTHVEALNARLRETRATTANRHAPAALQRELRIRPYGFFCLRQTWQTNDRKDYAHLRLLEEPVTLATGTARDSSWYLTPNGNQVAGAIAASTASQGLKTLVFTQTIGWANSAAKQLSRELGPPGTELTAHERHLYAMALDEAGNAERLYVDVNAAGQLQSACASHHGLLLPAERNLHESLFRRPDGINVLIATSTLAQGMNLPSEIVIIQGDSRFDPNANRMERLEAHELLNAAGRAGRAGDGSYGFVLVVPSKVVHFDEGNNRIHRHWGELQAIFARSDQCLEIDDPLTALLDEVQAAAGPLSANAQYLIRRLPVGGADDNGAVDEPRRFLNRSFAAHRARVRGDQAWLDARIDAAVRALQADPDAPEVVDWADRLAAQAGVPVGIMRALGGWLTEQAPGNTATTSDWRNCVLRWLEQQPYLVPVLIRRESLEGLFGTVYRNLNDDDTRGRHALPALTLLLNGWMGGQTLEGLERALGTPERSLGKCERAREFALRVLPEMAYLFGLPSQVIRALAAEGGEIRGSLFVDTLGACVREGFDRPEKLALRYFRRAESSRVSVHREFATIEAHLDPIHENETLAGLIRRIEQAVRVLEHHGL